jgi:hypothetical protein
MGKFTVQNGIEVQINQLNDWKQLLKDDVYLALEIFAKRYNDKAQSGTDIKRGTDLNNFVGNYLYFKERDELKNYLGKEGYEEYCKKIQGSEGVKTFPQVNESVVLTVEEFVAAHKKINKKPKIVLEWLETLPEPYRTQAINNTDTKHLSMDCNSIKFAIGLGFVWEYSREGFGFWRKFVDSLEE